MKKLETMTDWLSTGTDLKIDNLRDYLDTLDKHLESMADDYEKKVASKAKEIEDERERDEFYEWSSDEYWNYKEIFPRILLNSFHVIACTLLESEFHSIATRIGKKKEQVLDVSDIKGKDYLESACLYVKRLTEIDCNKFDTWDELTEGRRMRNIIVHSNGRITKDKDIELAKKYNVLIESSISISSGRPVSEISITHNYAEKFLDAIGVFFAQLYKETKAGNFL